MVIHKLLTEFIIQNIAYLWQAAARILLFGVAGGSGGEALIARERRLAGRRVAPKE
jgi:hypothetical protein